MSEEEAKAPLPPVYVQEPMHIYINKTRTYVGRTLLEELGDTTPPIVDPAVTEKIQHTFYSSDELGKTKTQVAESWKEEPSLDFCNKLAHCDAIVFDLNNCNHQALEFALKWLKIQDLSDKKRVIVLISSIMTWAHTQPLVKKEEGGEEQQEEGVEGEAKEEEPPEEESVEEEEEKDPEEEGKEPEEVPEEAEKKKKVLPFKESQYFLRVPAPQYNSFKFLETLALSIGMDPVTKEKKEESKLNVYVVCPGLIYGKGEDLFYEYFKRAWLQNPPKLPYIGKGLNLTPTIHVADLARLVKRVVRIRPKTKYIVGIDCTKRPTQKKIVTAIARAIGTGMAEARPVKDLIGEEWMLPLQINVKIRPSEAFKDEPTPEAEADIDPEEAEKRAKARKFPWHCENGIPTNIARLNAEFNEVRDLKPVKILFTAPPASGKSWFGKQLAQYYNIPHITSRLLEEEGKALKTDLGEDIRKRIEEDKEKKMEEYEALPKKVKKTIDISKYEPPVPDELLHKVLQWKLATNVCRNRGFVLDDYPTSYKMAQYTFLKPAKKDEEEPPAEGEAPNFEDYVLDQDISPSSITLLESSDKFVLQRVKNMTEAELEAAGKYTEDIIKKRLKEYRATNYAEDGSPSLADFFKERGIGTLTINIEEKPREIAMEQIKVFIERNGKPKNYMTEDLEKEEKRQKEVARMEEMRREAEMEYRQEEEKVEEDFRAQKHAIDSKRVHRYVEQDRHMLELNAEPIRNSILENIGDILSAGIAEVCDKLPDDPVEFLAKYLFRRSLEVEGKPIIKK